MSAAEEDTDKTGHQPLQRTLRFVQNDRAKSEKAAGQYESMLDDSHHTHSG